MTKTAPASFERANCAWEPSEHNTLPYRTANITRRLTLCINDSFENLGALNCGTRNNRNDSFHFSCRMLSESELTHTKFRAVCQNLVFGVRASNRVYAVSA